MNASLFASLVDPAILLFFFGILVGAIRSNLEIPAAIAKFCSLYLLLVVGFKGGTNLAATYGSVSAVTFITASTFVEQQGIEAGGYMAVALVLMESPAIIMAVLLANLVRSKSKLVQTAGGVSGAPPLTLRNVMHEAFTDGAHLLLLGGVLIGFLTGDAGKKALLPFTDLQKGILAFFLLDMGLLVAARAKELRQSGAFLSAFGILMPLFNAAVAMALAQAFGLGMGDAFLLTVLTASASYIVVPAVIRYAIPEANPSLYFTMSLAITFPFNILFGLPLYLWVIERLWS